MRHRPTIITPANVLNETRKRLKKAHISLETMLSYVLIDLLDILP